MVDPGSSKYISAVVLRNSTHIQLSQECVLLIYQDEASGDWDDWSKRLRKTHKVQTTTYTRSTRTNTVIEGRQTETKAGDVQTKPPSEEGMVEDSDNQ